MNSKHSTSCDRRAFTRTELVALVSVAAILLSLAVPAFGRNLTGARVIECLANKQELMRAWAAFAGDHDGTVPGVGIGLSTSTTNYLPEMPWARGTMSWDSGADNTNVLRLTDPIQASLAPYLNRKITPFKCPADVYQSPIQKARGWTRLRSVSANAAVGPGTDNGLLDPAFYRHITKVSEFTTPPPADTWVYIDEHPESINDTVFYPPSSSLQWVDFPAGYHDRAAGFGMADGSAQMHRWLSPRTVPPVTYNNFFPPNVSTPDDRADVAWVRNRTPHR